MISTHSPVWWNGRHRGLKIPWPLGRAGSSPVTGTKKESSAKTGILLFSGKQLGAHD